MKHKHMKALSVLLTVCLLVGLMPWTIMSARADYSGGDGTEGNPYLIETAADLINLSTRSGDNYGNDVKGKYFLQTADITLTETFTPIGNTQIFKGTYDGGNHVISGLSVSGVVKGGLFANVGDLNFGGTVKNVVLYQPQVSASSYAGAIAAYSSVKGIFENCCVISPTISGSNKGAIVGTISNGQGIQIKDCSVYGSTLPYENNNYNVGTQTTLYKLTLPAGVTAEATSGTLKATVSVAGGTECYCTSGTVFTLTADDSIVSGTGLKQFTTTAGTLAATDTVGTVTLTMPDATDAAVTLETVTQSITVAEATYTGSAQTPAVTVTDGDNTLTAGTDYTVAYSNNTNAAESNAANAPTATVTGKGNYCGTATKTFTIAQKEVAVSGITVASKTYDGTTDATLDVSDASFGKCGSDDLTVSGTGTFEDASAGTNKTVNITGLTLGGTDAGNYVLAASGQQTSTTANITPKPVTVSGVTAENKEYDGTTDATLVYSGASFGKCGSDDLTVSATGAFADANVDDGKTVNISGLTLGGTDAGNYVLAESGQQTSTTANITAKSITGATVTLDKTQFEYNGSEQSVSVTGVKLGDTTLTAGTDYDVTSGTTGTAKNTYTVTVTGKGNYKDTATATWAITDKPMTVSAPDVTATYDGTAHGIVVTVDDPASGATIKYGNAAGTYDLDASPTITGVGESHKTVYFQVTAGNYATYTGSATVTINPKSLTNTMLIIASATYEYTGSAITPTYTVKDGGTTLTASDYDVQITGNTAVGAATVRVTGKGNYTGTATGTFTISKASITPTVEVTGGPYTYTGSAIKPSVTVKVGGTTLATTNYTVEYGANVNAPTGTLTVKEAANGNYTFTQVEKTFDIGKIAWTNTNATATVKRGSTTTVQLANYVAPSGTLGAASPSAYTVNADTKTITINAASDAALGDFAVAIPVSNATNHNDYNITLTVTVTDKTPQTISFASGTVSKTYGDAAFTNALSGAHTSVSYTVTSGADVAEVDSTGKVTIKKAGTATIKATAAATAEYAGATATFTLNVGKADATVTAYHKTKYVGENDPSFDAKVEGLVNGDAESVIVYTITRDVGEGVGEYAIKLTGDAEQGNYNVTFVNGKLTIKPAKIDVSSVTLNRTTLPLTVGGTATLTATVEPSNASEPEVTWTSGTPTVATVDANGKVTARSTGTAIITATADGKSATCTVTVTAPTPTPTPTPSHDPTPSGRDDTPSTPSTTTTTTTDSTTTTNADGGKTESTSKTTETKNSDGSTTAKTTETATTTAADGSKTESKSETSTTTKANTDGTTTASTTATQTATTTDANGVKTTTETKTEAKETLDKSGNGTVEAKTTETVKDANGKVTETTVTESKGTVETAADGAKTTTTTNTATTTDANGNKTTTVTTEQTVEKADGSTGSVVTNENGETVSATATISEKAVEQAQKSGSAVTVPVTVAATNDAATATAVEITVPQGAERAKVEIPVENVKPGTVAVIVNPDGTEEIVKTSTTSDEGVVLTLDAGATVKLVDNTKPMKDVKGDEWYADNIAWATSHEVMNGVGGGNFAPNDPTTQGMMVQLLYNLDGNALVPAAEGEAWWSAADRWADGGNITQGLGAAHDPAAPAAREADILMMFNYAEAKGYDVSARADLSRFPDAANVSDEAREAMAWAVAAGLINGTTDAQGNVVLDPQGTATRAQISAIIERFCENAAR